MWRIMLLEVKDATVSPAMGMPLIVMFYSAIILEKRLEDIYEFLVISTRNAMKGSNHLRENPKARTENIIWAIGIELWFKEMIKLESEFHSMNLFTAQINGWQSWGKIFQSIRDLEPLIKYIFRHHNLPFTEIENCTPGTNAVFKVGGLVTKIFAPKESGMDTYSDYKTELFGIERANRLGIQVPQLVLNGTVEDKYIFIIL